MMILGHGPNTMTLDEAKIKLCAQAKFLGHDCNPVTLVNALHQQGLSVEEGFAQSKDAIIYVTIVVVFYVAIVVLLIGTNLKSGRNNRNGKSKKHVVDFMEGFGTQSRLVSSIDNTNPGQPNSQLPLDLDEDVADV